MRFNFFKGVLHTFNNIHNGSFKKVPVIMGGPLVWCHR